MENQVKVENFADQNPDELLEQIGLALESADVGIWDYRPLSRILYCSLTTRNLFGFTPTEALTVDQILERIGDEDRSRLTNAVLQTLQPGSEGGFHHEFTLTGRLDGEERILCANGKARLDETGMISRFTGIIQDITRQKRAEAALQYSQDYFQAIADTAPVLIWISGTDKLCNFFNKGWLDFTGRSMEQEYGNGWTEGVHPDDFDRCLAIYSTAFDSREAFSMEYRLLHHDGQYRWILDNGAPRYLPDGRFVGYIGSCIDIHETKTLNETLESYVAERTNALKVVNADLQKSISKLEQFSYAASHDLQEPLRKIKSFCDVLLDDYGSKVGDSGTDLIQRMQSAASRMQTLINGLLAYSRTSRQGPIEPVDLGALVRQVLDDLEVTISEQSAQITVGSLPVLMGDPLQFRQLFQNLLSNALKFVRPDEPPRIAIDSQFVTKAELLPFEPEFFTKWLAISVRDNGIGFASEYQDRIFTIFERLHSRAQYPGTGIGLAICKQVVENHRGVITARSQPGEGATFTIYLPITTA